MTLLHMFDNMAVTWDAGTIGGDQEVGTQFHVVTDISLVGLRFLRTTAGGSPGPIGLRLWEVGNSTPLVDISSVSDSGTVGWQTTAIPGSVLLSAGHNYIVSAKCVAGQGIGFKAAGSKPAPPPEFSWNTNVRNVLVSGYGYPSLAGSDFIEAIDFEASTTLPADNTDASLTLGNLRNEFARWISSVDITQADSIPALAYTLLQTVRDTLDAASTKITNNELYIAAALGPAGTLATGALRTLLDRNRDEATKILDLADSVLKTKLDALSADTAAIRDVLQNPVTPEPPTAPSATWVITDSGAETGPAVLTEPADFYNISITAYGGANRTYDVGGQTLFTFGWWVAPLRGGALGSYQTYRALSADVYEPGRRMPGLLVAVPADFEWTWEAWSYQAA